MNPTSSTTMFLKQFFRSRVSQRETREPLPLTAIPISGDLLPIKLKLFTVTGYSTIGPKNIICDDPDLITEPQMVLSLSRAKQSHLIKRGYAKLMVRHLSKMGVPEAEQPDIIGKIFKMVKVAVPRLPITVTIVDVTVFTPDEPTLRNLTVIVDVDRREVFGYRGLLWEFMETYKLADVRRHLLYEAKQDCKVVKRGGRLEATVRQTPCFICKEEVGVGGDRNRIARLQCSHFYHLDCFVSWRTKSHLCPLCQQPIADEPLKPYAVHHWIRRHIDGSIDSGERLNEMLERVKVRELYPKHLGLKMPA